MEYFDEQYENWGEYDNYQDDDDEYDYNDEWEYDDYYEPEEPPTRWQRFKNWIRNLYWTIKYKMVPQEMDDIPF